MTESEHSEEVERVVETHSQQQQPSGLGERPSEARYQETAPRYASSCRRVVSVGRCSIVTKTKSLHHLTFSKPAALPQVSSS